MTLRDKLKSIGFGFFIKYFNELTTMDKTELTILINKKQPNHYAKKALETRISNAKTIFFENLEYNALEIISLSKINEKLRLECKELLNKKNIYLSTEDINKTDDEFNPDSALEKTLYLNLKILMRSVREN